MPLLLPALHRTEKLEMTPERENDLVMSEALLGWVMDALAGNGVCDFGESFVEPAAALSARETLVRIADGCPDPAAEARATLMLLGNYPR